MTELSSNALEVAENRYFSEDENWEGLSRRVGQAIGLNEKNNKKWGDIFAEEIYNMYFIPAGRILRNSGKIRQSLLNCACLPISDSIESIGETLKNALIFWSYGAGLGIDFSPLREKGRILNSKGGVSSGMLSFLKSFDDIARTIETGGNRRSGCLGLCRVSHPEIFEFIDAKHEDGALSYFNISVGITNSFLQAVEECADWDLTFAGQTVRTVKANDLWDKLMESNIAYGDPGLINLDNLYKNNSFYFQPIEATNLCQPGWATVLTKNGINTLYSVNIGDYIWSEDGWVKIVNKNNSGIKDVYRYKTDGSVFYGVEDHKVKSKGNKIKVGEADSIDILRGICDEPSVISEVVTEGGNGLLCDAPVPLKFKFGTPDIVASFLKGLFTAFGTITETEEIQLSASSEQFVEDIQMMLSSLGVHSYTTETDVWTINIVGIDIRTFKNKIGFVQSLKNDKISNIILKNIFTMYPDDTTFDITSIDYVSTEQTYNITVDGKSHTYWSGGCNVANCGEVPLPGYGTCALTCLVLPSFIVNKNMNWKKLESSIYSAVRFLDNVLDINFYPIKQAELITKDSRRVGLGVMGLHDYLLSKNIRYGSEKSIVEIEKLFRFIRNIAYNASIALASEKGAFPKFSKTEFSKASFVRKLPAKIRMDIKDYGIRNTCLLTCPPAGTTSLLADVSSGIEPIFSLAYRRADRVSNRYYIHPKLLEFLESGETERPEYLVDIADLTPEDHLEVQACITKFVDNSISKTINCPKGTSKKELSRLLLEFVYDLKGATVYVDGSKEGQVLNKIDIEEVKQKIKDGVVTTTGNELVQNCKSGTCDT